VFGERSLNYAKTLKVVGTLLIIVGSTTDAKSYLQKALVIFENKGMLKMVKEVKNKIKLAQSGNKAQIIIECQREFGDKEEKFGSDEEMIPIAPNADKEERYGSTMQKRMANQRKPSKGKKVKTNNYMD
jgi:hypothetical protein